MSEAMHPLLEQLKEFSYSSRRMILQSIPPFFGLLQNYVSGHKWNRSLVGLCILVVPALVGICWQAVVAINVPEPYLDEVFHIPQAQKYCLGRWSEWDDKITTPPGLYVVGLLIHLGLWAKKGECSETGLRMTNWLAIILLGFTAMQCRRLIEARLSERDTGRPRAPSLSIYAIHTGLNISLFPLLFFFSALYYTDVFSTLVVLFAFQNHLERISPRGKPWLSDVWAILLGVTALSMRQTNVFWVVVFMGGLEAVHAVKTLPPPSEAQVGVPPKGIELMETIKYYLNLCSWGFIHDPALNLVSLDDVFFSVISITIAVLYNPNRVLRQVWPYVLVVTLFVAFVVWNGGVVLGDKSNHVATIHLSQMLYIWPLFAFFSAPLFISLIMLLFPLFKDTYSRSQWAEALRKDGQSKGRSAAERKAAAAESPAAAAEDQELSKIHELYRAYGRNLNLAGYASLVPVALVIVHLNTIIHPFTLADNRHYMFYVFRYTILRAWWVRYALAPAYVLCWAMCWKVLRGCRPNHDKAQDENCPVTRQQQPQGRQGRRGFISRPFPGASVVSFPTSQDATRRQLAGLAWRESDPTANNEVVPVMRGGTTPHAVHDLLDDGNSASDSPVSLSTALLWGLTTALSLVTAPLVEPRYFILPWVFWRLLLPAWPAHTCHRPRSVGPGALGGLFRVGRRVDIRLAVETAWFVVVNLVTAYIFVARPFYWRAEDGGLLDGGRLQRFMW